MQGVNKAIIVGALGQDPEIRHTADGTAVATLSVATNEKWKDSGGNQQEKTEWHRVVLWKRLAEIAGEYLKKGSSVYVEGKIETRKWQDQSGNDRYTTEIRGMSMQMLGGGGNNQGQSRPTNSNNFNADGTPKSPQQMKQQTPADNDYFDDSIPF